MGIQFNLSRFQVAFTLSVVLVGCFIYSMLSWTNSIDFFSMNNGYWKSEHISLGSIPGSSNSELYKSNIDANVSNSGAALLVTGGEYNTELPKTSVGGDKMNEDGRRFLLHVHYDQNGPSVQHFSFIEGVAYAIYSGRTIVEPLFFTHWTQEHAFRRLRTYHETYDAEELEKIVNVSTFAEFHDACNSSVDVLLIPPSMPVTWFEYQSKMSIYNDLFNISIPPYSAITNSTTERLRAINNSNSVKCLGIYEPSLWNRFKMALVPDAPNMLRHVEKYLLRSPEIRRMAENTANKMCGGRPFLALHWRNKTGETCKPGRPCQDINLIAAVNKTAAVAANDLKNFMLKNNLTCTYVAFPPFAESMIGILRDAKVPHVVTREDITSLEYPDVEQFKHDNYMLALIEQEICIRSSMFIATFFSSWSRVVMSARQVIGAPTQTLPDFVSWRDERVSLRR